MIVLKRPQPASSPAPCSRGLLRRLAEGLGVWLAFSFMLLVHPLYADANQIRTQGSGTLYFVDQQGQWKQPALILDSDFDIQVSGLIAATRLSRRFLNQSDHWQEGVFVFPLPDNASVHGLTMTVGERTIEGDIQPRAEARKRYQAARAAGQQAANLEQQRPNLFTARVANIPPGEAVAVELRYQQPVDYRAGVFEIRVPTTLTPRYMPGQPMTAALPTGGWAAATTEVPDAAQISPFTVRASDLPQDSHRATLALSIDAGIALASVDSPTHRVNTRVDGQRVEVRPQQGRIVMDRDLVVRWQALVGSEPEVALFHQTWLDENYLMAMVMPGSSQSPRLPRELVFVMDTSGSMAGHPIRQAKAAMQWGLSTLTPDDRFNVIHFNNQAHALFMQPQMATGQNLARARRYVDGLYADGGTEMTHALQLALQGAVGERGERVRQVVFVTDGAVGNEAALFAQIRRQLGDQRLFTVGIGSAPNMHFMREAARWGRGQYTAIADPADVSAPLQQLFSAMQAPVLSDLQVQWPGQGQSIESFPARPGDLYLGEPLVQVVRGQEPAGELTVSGRVSGGRRWEKRVDLQQASDAEGLQRLWARQKIGHLLDSAHLAGVDPDKDRITRVSLDHGVLSPYTAFVAVDRQPVRSAGTPVATEHLPTLLPAGAQSGMLRYPQTATGAPLLIVLGLAGALLALMLGWLPGRARS
ncbi:marine proteobacterial sortase target protein [Marinobacter salinisoli]|uniref:Marine proteobacterial sortase target protein n=1 Tax=Marinobacter salinisoli TaxID=2769486 RepID=A0ABX7MT50_9GAMM|nr:marine proteobacterial sortase target protein [Marinobacter salinisoli]QSP95348.1 marine proteobacterial sortase target protein [Marinobacter salinisoli]